MFYTIASVTEAGYSYSGTRYSTWGLARKAIKRHGWQECEIIKVLRY